ncbi:hypothetical protein SLA2020_338340 [Shorea laevis]
MKGRPGPVAVEKCKAKTAGFTMISPLYCIITKLKEKINRIRCLRTICTFQRRPCDDDDDDNGDKVTVDFEEDSAKRNHKKPPNLHEIIL